MHSRTSSVIRCEESIVLRSLRRASAVVDRAALKALEEEEETRVGQLPTLSVRELEEFGNTNLISFRTDPRRF